MPPTITDEEIAAQIQALLSRRSAGASICPSDAARALLPAPGDWRALMPRVRAVAAGLALAGQLRITQRGVALDPAKPLRGAIRLARAAEKAQSGE